MFHDQSRNELRAYFFQVWAKHQQNISLETLEQQVLQVILEHPEYHFIFNDPDKYLEQDYLPELGETNPFLHLSLHLSIREQLTTNRPQGIREIYQQLIQRYQDALTVEHHMMDCLVEVLWQAQRNNSVPNEAAYLNCLLKLLRK